MRAHKMFSRWHGAGGTALGADTNPPTAAPTTAMDHVIQVPYRDINGWPVHRLAILYKGPGGAVNLKCNLYVWDGLTEAWYRINNAADFVLKPGVVNYMDTLGELELPVHADNLDQAVGRATHMLLNVQDDAGAPAGEHVFAFVPDLTTIGY